MWVDFLDFHSTRQPNKIALIDDSTNQSYTYAQLHGLVCQWATTFHREGVRKGDRVAMLATNCIEHVTMFFGCAQLGAIFVPLNFRLGQGELEEQLERLDPLLFYGRGPCCLKHSAEYRDLDTLEPDVADQLPKIDIADTDPLLMLFTSGSTGLPKGVLLTAQMLLYNMINTQSCWGFHRDDVSVVQMPFFHTGGYNVILLPLLYLGGTVILMPKFDASRMLTLVDEKAVTVLFGVPTMFRMMQEDPGFKDCQFTHVRFCISGGAPCPVNLLEAFRQKGLPMKQGFGLTEVGPNCFYLDDADATDRPDTVGRPMMFLQLELRDEEDNPVPAGTVGELCLKGPTVCGGYWQMEEAFGAVCRDGWFHTGDLMRQDEQGFCYVVGRKKDMYISGGENVYPGEVVRQLVKHPSLEDAVVVPVPDASWGEVGYAFVRATESLDLNALRTFLDPLLSRYKHPKYLCILDQFPLLPNNKIDMAALKQKALEEVGHG